MKFNRQSRPLTQWIKIAKVRHNQKWRGACIYWLVVLLWFYSRLIFAKEKEFYLVDEAYASLLVQGDE